MLKWRDIIKSKYYLLAAASLTAAFIAFAIYYCVSISNARRMAIAYENWRNEFELRILKPREIFSGHESIGFQLSEKASVRNWESYRAIVNIDDLNSENALIELIANGKPGDEFLLFALLDKYVLHDTSLFPVREKLEIIADRYFLGDVSINVCRDFKKKFIDPIKTSQ